jgi:hypothetical protein
MISDDKWERLWKEVVVAKFKVLDQHGGTEKTISNLSQDSRSLGRDLNLGPPKYETGVLTTRLTFGLHLLKKIIEQFLKLFAVVGLI